MIAKKALSKKTFFYISMFGSTLVLCFLMLEYVFARFYYSDVYLISSGTFDSTIGWRLKPGTYWAKPPNTFRKHSVYINELGLRNREITSEKAKGIKRIIILGDSYTYGRTSRTEDIFTTLLDELLNPDPSSRKYEVINAGVPGYGNAQELLHMKILAEKELIADIYLLMVFTNDILDNLRLHYDSLIENPLQPGFVLDNNGNIELKYLPQKNNGNGTEGSTPTGNRVKRMKIAEVLKMRIETLLQTKPGFIEALNKIGLSLKFPRIPGLLNGWYREDILDTGIPLMKELIREIECEAKKRNSKLLVCLIPSQLQIYPDTYGPMLKKTFPDSKLVEKWLEDISCPQRIVSQICKELNMPFLDLFPAFVENSKKALYIPSEGHFSKNGHAVVARRLVDFITENAE